MNFSRITDRLLPFATVALALAGGSGSVQAAAFQNGGFESNNPLANSPDFSTTPAGWTKLDPSGSGLFLQTYGSFSLPALNADGTTAFGFGGNGAATGNLQQTFDTVIGSQYTVAFQYVIQQNTTPESFQVDASDGGTPLATKQLLHFSNLAWAFDSLTFTATSAQSTISFTDLSGAQDPAHAGVNWALDGVTVTGQAGPTSTPEPATWGVVGLGSLMCLAWRRRYASRGDSSRR